MVAESSDEDSWKVQIAADEGVGQEAQRRLCHGVAVAEAGAQVPQQRQVCSLPD